MWSQEKSLTSLCHNTIAGLLHTFTLLQEGVWFQSIELGFPCLNRPTPYIEVSTNPKPWFDPQSMSRRKWRDWDVTGLRTDKKIFSTKHAWILVCPLWNYNPSRVGFSYIYKTPAIRIMDLTTSTIRLWHIFNTRAVNGPTNTLKASSRVENCNLQRCP